VSTVFLAGRFSPPVRGSVRSLFFWRRFLFPAGEAKFLKKVIAHGRAVAIIRVRFRKNREWNFINH
jgi:hypothetical protein